VRECVMDNRTVRSGACAYAQKGCVEPTLIAEFLAELEHELRGHLSSIHSAAQLLQMRYDDAEIKRLAEAIYTEGDRVVQTLAAARQYANAGLATPSLKSEAEICRCIRYAWEGVPFADRLDVQLCLDPQIEKTGLVSADPELLSRCIGHLLHRAARVSCGKSKIYVGAKRLGLQIEISFTDCGPEIAADQFEEAFAPFG